MTSFSIPNISLNARNVSLMLKNFFLSKTTFRIKKDLATWLHEVPHVWQTLSSMSKSTVIRLLTNLSQRVEAKVRLTRRYLRLWTFPVRLVRAVIPPPPSEHKRYKVPRRRALPLVDNHPSKGVETVIAESGPEGDLDVVRHLRWLPPNETVALKVQREHGGPRHANPS